MNLFMTENPFKSIPIDSTYVETPLGTVNFDICINKKFLSSISIEEHSFQLNEGGKLFSYVHADFIAELVICEPIIRIPPHMKIEKAYGAVWRVKSLSDQLNCEFHTVLNPVIPHEIDAGADSGEHLEALTWDYKEYRLTLGTEDGVKLVERAKFNDMMPDRFNADDDLTQHSIVQGLKNGFNVPITKLKKNELCQVHFVIAWNKYENEDDVSTWYAVDMDGKSILLFEGLY